MNSLNSATRSYPLRLTYTLPTESPTENLPNIHNYLQNLKTIQATEMPLLKDKKPTENEEINNRSGHVWKCIDRKKDFSGYLYLFEIRIEFNDLTAKSPEEAEKFRQALKEKKNEIFPAVEIDPYYFYKYGGGSNPFGRTLGDLGYKSKMEPGRICFWLPDREALLDRWENLRKDYKRLPELDIFSSDEDTTSDSEFIEAYLKHDILMSTKKEFVHDSTVHAIPILVNMINSSSGDSYREEMNKVKENIARSYRVIQAKKREIMTNEEMSEIEKTPLMETLKQVETIFSSFVDGISVISIEKAKTGSDNFFEYLSGHFFKDDNWKCYFGKRYGKNSFSPETFYHLWTG